MSKLMVSTTEHIMDQLWGSVAISIIIWHTTPGSLLQCKHIAVRWARISAYHKPHNTHTHTHIRMCVYIHTYIHTYIHREIFSNAEHSITITHYTFQKSGMTWHILHVLFIHIKVMPSHMYTHISRHTPTHMHTLTHVCAITNIYTHTHTVCTFSLLLVAMASLDVFNTTSQLPTSVQVKKCSG